jgi:hypothetical protein
MGKQKARLIGFFNGKRRECELVDLHVHKNQSGVRWIRLAIQMPLSGKSVAGMPEAFAEQFILMEKQSSIFNLAKNEAEIDGATIVIFPTDTMKAGVVDAGATLQNFTLVAEGVADKRKVRLEFTAEVPYSVALRDWSCDHLHATFWMEVTSSQLEIPQVVEEKKARKPKQQELVQ